MIAVWKVEATPTFIFAQTGTSIQKVTSIPKVTSIQKVAST
ncbi:hypothetical protein VCG_002366 [Vibrio cholerae 12129(1)]|nr:hypothetical protein VCG_002366 [Vibrio cholerae 12129(1)]